MGYGLLREPREKMLKGPVCCLSHNYPHKLPLFSRVLVSSYFLLWLGYFRGPSWEEKKVLEAKELSKTPVITFGTMGTNHSIQDYGAGPSGINDTGTFLLCLLCVAFIFDTGEGRAVCSSDELRRRMLLPFAGDFLLRFCSTMEVRHSRCISQCL